MAQTYSEVWRAVKLHASAAPTFLVREWVNEAWKTLARKRQWAFRRKLGVIQIAASRSVSVTVTKGSATVTSVGGFVAADNSRQFRIAPAMMYTIVAFVDPNTITLDRIYGEENATATAEIFDGYFVTPSDFGAFDLIADPYNQRRLGFWITADQLNILDPTRQVGDSGPRILGAAHPSTHPTTLGRIRYEYWPRPTVARSYPFYYFLQAADLTDGFTFTGVLADGGDVIQVGALAQAAKWPGTTDKPNPYFNLSLADRLEKEFDGKIQQLALRDDDQQGQDLTRVHWEHWPLADLAYNDMALRSTDASILDLY